jgi:fibronectin type 3 domain-containing protein
MTFRKHVMISIVLLCVTGLLIGCSEDGTVAPAATTYEAPPIAVSGLTVKLLSNGAVSLMWDANTQPNLRGYNVYRHSPSESAIALLNSSPVGQNRYTDATVERGPVYEYMVTSVSTKGAESAFTSITINTDPPADRGIKPGIQ